MQPDWQNRSEEEETVNPFAPIDYAARLRSSARPASQTPAPPRPGSLYGGLGPMKPIQPPPQWSAPPVPAAEGDIPSYLKKKPASGQETASRRTRMEKHRQEEETADWTLPAFAPEGTPYAQMQFDAPQPAQEAPPLDEIAAFFSQEPLDDAPPVRTEDEIDAFFGEAPAQEPPAYNLSAFSDQEESEDYRDAFAPAAPPEAAQPPVQPVLKDAYAPAEQAAPKAGKPPVRIWRVAALGVSAAMLIFCGVAGLRTLTELSRNERDMQSLRQEYREQTGQELQSAGSRVELLPAGQTFTPTAAPTPTAPPHTPTPAPIIPINEAAIAYLNPHTSEQVEEEQQIVSAPLRTRLTAYPDNPLQNVMDGLVELQKQSADVTGRLVIDGLVDEVVVQRDNMYYLTHDWQGSYSPAGAVFMDETCSLKMPPENLLLRGQCSSGSPFGPLLRFATEGPAFSAQYSWATLTTLYEENRYRLFAVIVTPSDPVQADYFSYSSYPTFGSDAEMLTYVEKVKARSLYDFGVDVSADDRLLTLATVGSGDSCLVLVYRTARPGE